MPETTRSRSRDRSLVSDEAYEIEYLHKKFPQQSHDAVKRAVDACKAELKGSEDRKKIMACLERRLK